MPTNEITPADDGILAVTIDDCLAQGFGDDDTLDALRAALRDLDLSADLAHAYYYRYLRA